MSVNNSVVKSFQTGMKMYSENGASVINAGRGLLVFMFTQSHRTISRPDGIFSLQLAETQQCNCCRKLLIYASQNP